MQSGLTVLEFNLLFYLFKVKYYGTKSYNKSFKHEGLEGKVKATTYSVKNLVPGSQYDFEVYATSVCGNSTSSYVEVETRMEGEHFLLTLIKIL